MAAFITQLLGRPKFGIHAGTQPAARRGPAAPQAKKRGGQEEPKFGLNELFSTLNITGSTLGIVASTMHMHACVHPELWGHAGTQPARRGPAAPQAKKRGAPEEPKFGLNEFFGTLGITGGIFAVIVAGALLAVAPRIIPRFSESKEITAVAPEPKPATRREGSTEGAHAHVLKLRGSIHRQQTNINR